MRRAMIVSRVLLAFVLTAFVACGGDGITDPPGGVTDTAAANAAARIASTNALLSQMEDAINALGQSLSAGGVPSGSPELAGGAGGAGATLASTPPDAAKCVFDPAAVRHVCPAFTQTNGVVVTTWYQFLDAQSQPHEVPDTAKTVAIRRFIQKAGVVNSQHTSQAGTVPAIDTMKNADTLTLTGLKGPPEGRRLNGKGTMSVVIVPQGQPVARISATTTTENFAFAPPATPPATAIHYPVSGKVTAIVTSVREDQPQAGSTTSQVTSYDGSKIAKLVISLLNGTVLRTCTWDMTAANVAPTCTVP